VAVRAWVRQGFTQPRRRSTSSDFGGRPAERLCHFDFGSDTVHPGCARRWQAGACCHATWRQRLGRWRLGSATEPAPPGRQRRGLPRARCRGRLSRALCSMSWESSSTLRRDSFSTLLGPPDRRPTPDVRPRREGAVLPPSWWRPTTPAPDALAAFSCRDVLFRRRPWTDASTTRVATDVSVVDQRDPLFRTGQQPPAFFSRGDRIRIMKLVFVTQRSSRGRRSAAAKDPGVLTLENRRSIPWLARAWAIDRARVRIRSKLRRIAEENSCTRFLACAGTAAAVQGRERFRRARSRRARRSSRDHCMSLPQRHGCCPDDPRVEVPRID
jgi:hypothetical protein